jgi:LPXTG-site transpeptidase (sortase) family protein
VPIAATPLIGVAKAATFVAAPALPGRWDVTYQILVRNYGNVPLSAVQVTDNLLATFPPPTTFTLLPGSVTSTTLTVNPGFNGTTNTDLLTGVNTLAVGASGTITLKVRVTPLIAGPFNNTATGYGTPPVGGTVDDDSMDGVDPDPAPKDGDPTNNDLPTPVTFGPAIFDPPVGFKTFDASGLPLLQWQMVWINNANFSAIDVQVDDPIPAGTIYSPTYPATGILPLVPLPDDSAVGVSCTTPPLSTTTTDYCYYEGPSFSYPLGRIRWQGNLGADLGAVDAATAANELLITFNINVPTGITSAYNVATSHTDRTGLGLSPTTATDPVPVSSRWPTSAMGGGGDDPGDSQGFSKLKKLPSTGFAPGIVSLLPLQPEGLAYSAYSDLRVEIPSLKVNVDIVGVPWKNDDWDITWLGGNAGYLDGTAFPTWLGNSVITGHVYAADGLPGPFVNLGKLKWGDRVVIHAFGQKYIYEVRSVRTVSPYNNSVLGHKEEAWVTLLTCKDYNDLTGQYKMRTAVQAVLITVVDE